MGRATSRSCTRYRLADLPTLSRASRPSERSTRSTSGALGGLARRPGAPLGAGSVVYDIDDETRFDTDKGGMGLTYAELCEEQAIYGQLRCSSGFIQAAREGDKPTRCRVTMSEVHGCVGVWVDGDAAGTSR